MSRPLLSEEEIDQALASVAWTRDGSKISRTVQLGDFRQAIAFVQQVADVAEELNHHPDIAISWNRVGLEVTTHDSGGLTGLDFELARRIDALGAGR